MTTFFNSVYKDPQCIICDKIINAVNNVYTFRSIRAVTTQVYDPVSKSMNNVRQSAYHFMWMNATLKLHGPE